MDRMSFFGALSLFLITQLAEGHPLSFESLQKAKVLYTYETASRLNQEHALSEEVRFRIPKEVPTILTLETRSTLRGRLNLFLEPESLPEDLGGLLSQQNRPDLQAAFQVVIDTEPGSWQRHTLDLSRDFFETIRPETYPYDPRGLTIKRLRIEVAEPSRTGLQMDIRNIKVFQLTRAAQQQDLVEQVETLEGILRLTWRSLNKKYNLEEKLQVNENDFITGVLKRSARAGTPVIRREEGDLR